MRVPDGWSPGPVSAHTGPTGSGLQAGSFAPGPPPGHFGWCTNHWYARGVPVASSPDPLALEEQVCFALAVAARTVIAVYRPVLEPLGLTHPQYLVMLALWGHDRLAVKDLSRLLRLDPGTLSPLVKRLETQGLVRRDRDPEDERVLAITLTPAGRDLRRSAEAVPGTIVDRLGLDVEELRRLHATLGAVITAADRAWESGDE
jgi:DNA-binding MarR family transcriptional regulator